MRKLDFAKVFAAVFVICMALAVHSFAQTVTAVSDFQSYAPSSALVQDTNGNLYGNAASEGIGSEGNAYEVTPGGTMTQLSQLEYPAGGLVLASNGSLYGSTQQGGVGYGNIFKMNTEGTVTSVYDQFGANTTLIQVGGELYGSTNSTIFKVTLSGNAESTLYNYCLTINCNDDGPPYPSALTLGMDGNFYGTTAGGNVNDGTVFKMTPSGTLETIHTFSGADGSNPAGGLVQGADGDFYGVAVNGGNSGCTFGESSGCGTVFKISRSGSFTTVHKFSGADGENPQGSLVLGTDGNFYGVTWGGGTENSGTVFQITSSGAFTTIYSFCQQEYCLDGATPAQTLMQDTSGLFYGTTRQGGNQGLGVVYSLSMGLGPFVTTAPGAASIGTKIIILGNSLTGASAVTFNGAPASSFTVVSDTEIKATVPSGATTGTVQVTTPVGTLNSNVAFQVR